LDKLATELFSRFRPGAKSDLPQHYVVRFNIGFDQTSVGGTKQLPIGIKHYWVDVIDGLNQPVEDRRRLQVFARRRGVGAPSARASRRCIPGRAANAV
jgi:hypothetical protein